jgi:formylglycine-generating enzyme required for sulfatase activity
MARRELPALPQEWRMTALPYSLPAGKSPQVLGHLCWRWLITIQLCLLAHAAPAQTAPERPRSSVTPVLPASSSEADTKAERRAAAQRAEDKRAMDRRIAEAQAKTERERQAREKLELDRRIAQAQAQTERERQARDKQELDKRIAEAQAQTERERQAREKQELDKRIAEAQAQTERERQAREKQELDKRIAEAQAQAERERQAREKLEADKRRLESESAELERKLRMAEQTRSAPGPAQASLAVAVARHPAAGELLLARQTFVDSWGQFTAKESAPRMVVIAPSPAHGFQMGSPVDENGRAADEKQHRVTIRYAFALSETEITYAHWDACVADGGCGNSRNNAGWGRNQYPVVHVNWHQARAYADWLNQRLRLARDNPYRYRLPSEAEWEYAARADSIGPFGFVHNRNIAPDLANYDTRVAYMGSPTREWNRDTKPVGSYPANAFGPKDMLGNVWEWVADCYEPDYDRTPRDGSAHREYDNACPLRVVRGGSWYLTGEDLRVANRFRAPPGYRDDRGGFRIVRTLPPAG